MKRKYIRFTIVLSVMLITLISLQTATYAAFPTSGTTKCYTISASGRATTYTTSLMNVVSGYIERATDEIWITQISGNKAYGSYPISGGRKNAWFYLYEVAYENTSHTSFKATQLITTYARNTLSVSYGSISNGDTVTVVFNDGTRAQVIYPISGGYKIAWIKSSSIPNISNPPSSTWQYPMANATCSWTSSTNMSWGNYSYSSSRPTRSYHVGIDLKSKTNDSYVYAAASGIVRKSGNNTANGNYVVIQHTIDQKTVYSFYAHLSTISVSVNNNVTKGQKIGVWGSTGTSAVGTHLHFAIVSSLCEGNYVGYATSFSGDKTTYDSITFYNPVYVIEKGKLP
jgi:murein DD-endopeptidase MepM/ murein hydrolase activator NlpD